MGEHDCSLDILRHAVERHGEITIRTGAQQGAARIRWADLMVDIPAGLDGQTWRDTVAGLLDQLGAHDGDPALTDDEDDEPLAQVYAFPDNGDAARQARREAAIVTQMPELMAVGFGTELARVEPVDPPTGPMPMVIVPAPRRSSGSPRHARDAPLEPTAEWVVERAHRYDRLHYRNCPR